MLAIISPSLPPSISSISLSSVPGLPVRDGLFIFLNVVVEIYTSLSPVVPPSFPSGRVLKCNIAKPMQHKLGATKAVWSTDEWFKTQLAEDKDLGDQLDFEELVPEAVGK